MDASGETTFRLRRQTAGRGRFAEVTVRVEAARQNGVVVSDRAFAWRLDAYGPDAVFGGAFDAEPAREAVDGLWAALRARGEAAPSVLVSVARIVESYADTGPGDIRFAAEQAVLRALGREPGGQQG
ncbi:hypothetical protein ACFO4E_24085 [Nocardiopsis mangrovi]|uniref:Uncharacterized protein n=1 Tax=Nocardiopsis mangrovi TaxID=1179818 RepID=A0ABV9E3P6_9ACTN